MRTTIIEAIGELAHGMIFRSPNAMVGKIIHTFTNTIYIKTDDDNLICITSSRISRQLSGNALAAARMLSNVNRKDSILDANSPFHNRLLSVASKMAYAAGSKSFDEIQDIIPHTIGLGSGFTPSGDD